MQSLLSHPAIAMLVMLGSLVLFHELGHYLAGRLCGVAIEKFAIGFGQKIIAFKRNGTEFLIGWIPLGGYVKFYGATRNEDLPNSLQGMPYYQAPVWKRMIIVAAGPLANFLLAFFVFWGLIIHGIEHPPSIVGDVLEGGRAQQAGIQPGDRFIELDGTQVSSWGDIERIFQKNPERQIKTTVDRQGKNLEIYVTPEAVTGRSIFGSIAKIGRVGVALGYPSAVVTVKDMKSPLGLDGIVTGDRFEGWIASDGSVQKFHGLHDMFSTFLNWKRDGISEIKVVVQPIQISESDGRTVENSAGKSREILLRVNRWPPNTEKSARSYSEMLGVSDSHLTVGLSRGKLSDVLLPGDVLIAWNSQPLKTIFHLQEIMQSWKQPETTLKIQRKSDILNISVPLKAIDVQMPEGPSIFYSLDIAMLGITKMPEPWIKRETNPIKAAKVAFQEGLQQTSMMVIGLWQIISGAVPVKALGGPIMIAKVAGDSAKAGWVAFAASLAVISINLGLVNLFPIPILDGGQLVLLSLESLKGKPIEEQIVENFQKVGFVMVMSLVVLALYNDLSRFWSSILGSMLGQK